MNIRKTLWPRELQVARLVAKHMLDKEIAVEMNVSENTVKKYVQNIFAKLKVNRRSMVGDALKPTLDEASAHAPCNYQVYNDDHIFISGGYYTLVEMEAICAVARHQLGPDTIGLEETIINEENKK